MRWRASATCAPEPKFWIYAVECRDGICAFRVGPSLLVRLLARLLVERGDALAGLPDVRAGAEFLEIRVECRDRPGRRGLGPGLLVGLLARLLVGRGLLLLLGRSLLLSDCWLQAETRAAPATTAKSRQVQKSTTRPMRWGFGADQRS